MGAEPQLQSTEPWTGDAATPDDFKAVFRDHPSGVAVITMAGPDGPAGLTVTSVASVSAAPPLLVFSLAAGSSSRPAVEHATSVVVNFLAEDQRETADVFARRGVDRFAQVAWDPLPTGEPVLDGVAAWILGRIDQRIPVGDSLLITVRADRFHRREAAPRLLYVDRTYHRIGDLTRAPGQGPPRSSRS